MKESTDADYNVMQQQQLEYRTNIRYPAIRNGIREMAPKSKIKVTKIVSDRYKALILGFACIMSKQLRLNSNKGEFEKYHPAPPDLFKWINKNVEDLAVAIAKDDKTLVTKHAADLANYAMKAAELYGENV